VVIRHHSSLEAYTSNDDEQHMTTRCLSNFFLFFVFFEIVK
jgi:hypothetical protein